MTRVTLERTKLSINELVDYFEVFNINDDQLKNRAENVKTLKEASDVLVEITDRYQSVCSLVMANRALELANIIDRELVNII